MATKFSKPFTQQEPIPPDAIAAAINVMQTGRLHRYNTVGDEISETVALEAEYARFQDAAFCLAVASGGQAIQIALRAAAVTAGDAVLTNAFTLAPVPGAIAAVGGVPIFVETDRNLRIDLADLAAKAGQADYLLLSHMRGHIADMDEVMETARAHDLTVIEDCAHTMGAKWDGKLSGNFGLAGCFSTQTYKHMNSGEGGLLTSADPEFMARATILSGSYMLYGSHSAGPGKDAFEQVKWMTPNCSARMDNLRAAILRPQLAHLSENIARWNTLHDRLAGHLRQMPGVRMSERPEKESYVASSIQFFLDGRSAAEIGAFIARCEARGVVLKWFGGAEPVGFTSRYDSWKYAPKQHLPQTVEILSGLMDMRLPLTFEPADCDVIATIIREELPA